MNIKTTTKYSLFILYIFIRKLYRFSYIPTCIFSIFIVPIVLFAQGVGAGKSQLIDDC